MPLIVQVGLSKKIGQPNYGSLGASCNLGLELDQALLVSDLETLQSRVRQAFDACRQAVQEELFQRTTQSAVSVPAAPLELQLESDHSAHKPARPNSSSPPAASRKQLDYATKLATQIQGLGSPRLEPLALRMFAVPLAELSHSDASELIDVLKQIKEGVSDLEAIWEGYADA